MESIVMIDLLIRLLGTPRLDGLATYYDRGLTFRNGEPFALDAPLCAVDASEWSDLRGKRLLILTDASRWALLEVGDTGYLYHAGHFQKVRGEPYYLPSTNDDNRTDVLVSGPKLRVVLDVPLYTFVKSFGSLETQRVWAWEIPEGDDSPFILTLPKARRDYEIYE